MVAGTPDRGRREPNTPAEPPAAPQQPAPILAPPEATGRVPNREAAETKAVNAEGDDGTPVQELDPALELLRGLCNSIYSGECSRILGDEKDVHVARTNDEVDKKDMSAAQANAKFDWAAYRRAVSPILLGTRPSLHC